MKIVMQPTQFDSNGARSVTRRDFIRSTANLPASNSRTITVPSTRRGAPPDFSSVGITKANVAFVPCSWMPGFFPQSGERPGISGSVAPIHSATVLFNIYHCSILKDSAAVFA